MDVCAVYQDVLGLEFCHLHGLEFDLVRMYKRRDYVELYEKDQAKWALVRNVNTVFKHSTLLPVCVEGCQLRANAHHSFNGVLLELYLGGFTFEFSLILI